MLKRIFKAVAVSGILLSSLLLSGCGESNLTQAEKDYITLSEAESQGMTKEQVKETEKDLKKKLKLMSDEQRLALLTDEEKEEILQSGAEAAKAIENANISPEDSSTSPEDSSYKDRYSSNKTDEK